MRLPVNSIIQGHVIDVLRTMPADCIHTVVTSPPYWALRDYGVKQQLWDGSSPWSGQLGLEPSSDAFIDHLCSVFDEVKRVLRPSSTCWVNLGDTYSGSSNGNGDFR